MNVEPGEPTPHQTMKTTFPTIITIAATCTLSLAAIPSKADLERCDENRNGSLERGELERLSDQQRSAALDAYDRNNDGEISASELAAGPQRAKKDDDKDNDKDKNKNKKHGGKKHGNKGDGNKGGGNKGGGQKKAPPIPRITPL